MAVIVEFEVPEATLEQAYAVEALTRARGAAAGRPPYVGCMFFATMPTETGFRCTSAWRTESDFRAVMETMLGPDLSSVGRAAVGITVSPVVSMAIPGAHGP